MTEAEWLAIEDPTPLLKFLRGEVSNRKLRLFAVGCCRRLWHLMLSERSRTAIEVAERFADGQATNGERHAAARGRSDVDLGWCFSAAAGAAGVPAFQAAQRGSGNAQHLAAKHVAAYVNGKRNPSWGVEVAHEARRQVSILWDIFGNPFRPVAFDPQWLTSDVLALARGIYDERAFDRMPILADALQDAGCENGDVLDHCRDPTGAHVRGCWVVDCVLGLS